MFEGFLNDLFYKYLCKRGKRALVFSLREPNHLLRSVRGWRLGVNLFTRLETVDT